MDVQLLTDHALEKDPFSDRSNSENYVALKPELYFPIIVIDLKSRQLARYNRMA
jgi:hypothetical protein